MKPAFSFDTSSLIECWSGRYTREIFPGVWEGIEETVDAGSILVAEEVLNEAKRKDEDLYNWIKARKDEAVVPLEEEIMVATSEILSAFPRLTGQARGRNRADPFVIALARVEGLTVVTEEGTGGSERRPKIPLVCQHFGVPCVNVLRFMRDRDWRLERA